VHAAHDHAPPCRIAGVAAKPGAVRARLISGKAAGSLGVKRWAGSDVASALRLDFALRLLGQLAPLRLFLFLECRQGIDLRPLQGALGDGREYASEMLAYVLCSCFHVGQL
jgi:hypothetical protein